MTKPWPCPKENPCAYCPGGPPYGVPQSYTGHEPAAMRGLQSGFDPYGQVRSRVEQLEAIGHTVDKVEIIIMGGTFPSMSLDYQEHFIQRCLDAITQKESLSLEEAKKAAETSQIRNVGITVETRPDWAKEREVDHMLSMGVTRVELGVQNIYDDIYNLVDRDLKAFQAIFTVPSFKPDMIKIYPCLVLKGTKTYDWWKMGMYRPYTTEEATHLIVEIKKMIPPWVRIMRVQRDIPAHLIEAGVNQSNLRQLVLRRLREQRMRCRCIRCREVGHRRLKDGIKPDPENVRILTTKEKASEGEELFLSAEDTVSDILIGYLRLRIPSHMAHRSEIFPDMTSIVRELHVYGPLVPVGRHMIRAWQHKGYGGILLSEAERISQEDYDLRKMVVTSALGTKQYFWRRNYINDGPYVSKML
jgi:elongator complex protein 3